MVPFHVVAALTFSTQDLAITDDQSKIKAALSGLLTTAAAKFYISAAGLVASLFITLDQNRIEVSNMVEFKK